MILLPETDPDNAIVIAERLCREIGNTNINWQCQSTHLTASFGVSGIDTYMDGISPDVSDSMSSGMIV